MCHFSLLKHFQGFSSTLWRKFWSFTWAFKSDTLLLLISPCIFHLNSNKKSECALKVSASMSLFLLFVHHGKRVSCPSFQAQPEFCLLHEAQAQMTALSLDSKDGTHFNGSSYHTLPPIRALGVNTESEHCDGGLYRPPVASSCKALHCEGTEYMLSELKWKFEIYCMQGLLAPRSWLWCGEETKRSHEVDEYPRISWEALAHSRPNKYVFWNKDMVMDSCALQLLFKSPSNYGGGWLSTRILLSGGPRRERCAN